jgi:hypothetical protein
VGRFRVETRRLVVVQPSAISSISSLISNQGLFQDVHVETLMRGKVQWNLNYLTVTHQTMSVTLTFGAGRHNAVSPNSSE